MLVFSSVLSGQSLRGRQLKWSYSRSFWELGIHSQSLQMSVFKRPCLLITTGVLDFHTVGSNILKLKFDLFEIENWINCVSFESIIPSSDFFSSPSCLTPPLSLFRNICAIYDKPINQSKRYWKNSTNKICFARRRLRLHQNCSVNQFHCSFFLEKLVQAGFRFLPLGVFLFVPNFFTQGFSC